MQDRPSPLTSNHWGVGLVDTDGGRITAVKPHPRDPAPNRLNENIPDSLYGPGRIRQPAVRASWLDHGPAARAGERGRDPFVEVSWDQVLDLLAGEITRVRSQYGNQAIYAGSYGWSSAGRVHHAQGLLKRFLNTQGGFVRSEGNYSYNAALVLLPFIVGPFYRHVPQSTRWSVIAEHSELVVAFGGLAERNTRVCDGGASLHRFPGSLKSCAQAGVRFINVSPLRTDMESELNAEWLAIQPGTDTAMMLALAYVLLDEGLHDQAFLDRYTVGFDRVAAYLRGETDGQPKTPGWAAALTGLDPDRLTTLAREMAARRTMITTTASLQRGDFGEQPLWATVTLAAMLGQIGLPGGGYTIAMAVNSNIGNTGRLFRAGVVDQGINPVREMLPVAMISEMLLHPGGGYRYKGQERRFPDIRMVWWAGGNPFHHHQDLNRLRKAFARPETVVVNEISWTATARHADVVLPVAAPEERTDFGAGQSDDVLVPMPAHAAPAYGARLEYDIYADLAGRLGGAEAFTKGRDAEGWTRRLWQDTQETAAKHGLVLPDWDTFIGGDMVQLPDPNPDQVFLSDFRADPVENPLPTTSGRIELFCAKIDGFGLPDCPGQATWFPPRDAPDEGPLALISGQPGTRLHSQQDDGAYSRSMKIKGREPVLIHPNDAAARGISDGSVVELFNSRGRCLAGARVTDDVREGCVFLWTGAWYDPDFESLSDDSAAASVAEASASPKTPIDRHGNPNVLTHDQRTSSLSQSPAAHSARVEVRAWPQDRPLPSVRAFEPPAFESRS